MVNFLILIKVMKFKWSKVLLIAGAMAVLSACGGNDSSREDNNTPIANGSATGGSGQMTAPEPAVDVNAKNPSKGVGRFTDVKLTKLNEEMAEKGEQLFQMKCSACHKLTDQKLVGPGLKGITAIRTPEWIMNMITNPAEMTQKDPVAKALLEQNLTQMSVQVTDEEAREIMEYLRKNDGGE